MSSELTPDVTSEPPAEDQSATIAAAVLDVAGVAGLHGGVLGEVATYLPGKRVAGVRLDDETTEVHIVLDWGSPALATAEAVRTALEALVPGPVHVLVEDVASPSIPEQKESR